MRTRFFISLVLVLVMVWPSVACAGMDNPFVYPQTADTAPLRNSAGNNRLLFNPWRIRSEPGLSFNGFWLADTYYTYYQPQQQYDLLSDETLGGAGDFDLSALNQFPNESNEPTRPIVMAVQLYSAELIGGPNRIYNQRAWYYQNGPIELSFEGVGCYVGPGPESGLGTSGYLGDPELVSLVEKQTGTSNYMGFTDQMVSGIVLFEPIGTGIWRYTAVLITAIERDRKYQWQMCVRDKGILSWQGVRSFTVHIRTINGHGDATPWALEYPVQWSNSVAYKRAVGYGYPSAKDASIIRTRLLTTDPLLDQWMAGEPITNPEEDGPMEDLLPDWLEKWKDDMMEDMEGLRDSFADWLWPLDAFAGVLQ